MTIKLQGSREKVLFSLEGPLVMSAVALRTYARDLQGLVMADEAMIGAVGPFA